MCEKFTLHPKDGFDETSVMKDGSFVTKVGGISVSLAVQCVFVCVNT